MKVALRDLLVERQGNRCFHCSREMTPPCPKSTPTSATLEHLIELAEGGPTDDVNCVAACWKCNNQRGEEYHRRKQMNEVTTNLVALPTVTPDTTFIDMLTVDDTNARVGDPANPDKLQTLIASIISVGLLQPLVVVDRGSTFGVVAGRRRLLALQQIHSGHIEDIGAAPAHDSIPILRIPALHAAEASLAENYAREEMSTAQLYTAFKAMADAGNDDAKIADAFGYTEQRVGRILRLSGLHPTILEAWSKGDIREDGAQAFASTTDQAIQLQVYESLASYQRGGRTVREEIRKIVQGETISDHLLKFGKQFYIDAGGTFERDLFDDSITVLDPPKFYAAVAEGKQAFRDRYKIVNLEGQPVTIDWLDEPPTDYWRDRVSIESQSYASVEDKDRWDVLEKQVIELEAERDELPDNDDPRDAEIEQLITVAADEQAAIESRMIPVVHGHDSVRAFITVGYDGEIDVEVLKPLVIAEPKLDADGQPVATPAPAPAKAETKDPLTARARCVLNGMRQEIISRGMFDADEEGLNQVEAHRALLFMLGRATLGNRGTMSGFCSGAAGQVYSNPDHRYRPGALLLDGAWLDEPDAVEAFKNFPASTGELSRIAAMIFVEKVESTVGGAVRTVPHYLSTVRAIPSMLRRVWTPDEKFFELFRKGQILGFFEEALGGKSGFYNRSGMASMKEGELRRKAVAFFNPRSEACAAYEKLGHSISEAEKKKLESWVPEWLQFASHDAFASPKPKAAPKPKAEKKATKKPAAKKAPVKKKELEDA